MEDSQLIGAQCKKEYDNGMQFKQGRVKDWQATEDLYFGRVKKVLKGRFNIPIPIMSGFIDTLQSKIDEPPALKFSQGKESGFKAAQKTQSFYEEESTSEDADWDSLDLDNKKLASFHGRAIYKCYGERNPKYKFNLFISDPYDFYCDPMGGGNLENHRFCGEDNIFRTKYDLIEGAKAGIYDKSAVGKLLMGIIPEQIQQADNAYQNKANRFSALGLSSQMYNFVGDGLLRFVESGTTWHGKRYYVLWNYETGIAIRCKPIVESGMFKSGLWWWTSWATHRDSFNFWSKAPADDIRPIAETIKILANQELDNRQKKNWPQRAYDPAIFPNSSELNWRPDGLVRTKSGASSVQSIANGIYTFETPELNGTINLVEWLDNMAGKKSGVTADSQGQSDEKKVGIYYGNLQQVADRLGLYNRSYSKCHVAIGRRFVWSLYENLNEKVAVKLIGEKGVEWDTLTRKEVDPLLKIKVEGGNAQLQADEIKRKTQMETLSSIEAKPELANRISPKWLIETKLRNGGFSDEDIRTAFDTDNYADRELLSEASQAIEEIIAGKNPKLNRGATTGFLQKILDFAYDHTDDDFELFNRLIAYINAHQDIVMENMNRRAYKMRSMMGMGVPNREINLPDQPNIAEAMADDSPSPNTFGGTMSRVQSVTSAI